MSPVIGVTLSTTGYHDLATEAAARWRHFARTEAIILTANRDDAFDLKFQILNLAGDRTVCFFDADLWLIAPMDISRFTNTSAVWAVKDASRHAIDSFCLGDALALNFPAEHYVNTGFFAVNGRNESHHRAFAEATSLMALKRAGGLPAVKDRTEQSVLNAAWQRCGVDVRFLGHEFNFWPRALSRGFYAKPIPFPLCVHAADVPLAEKEAFLRKWCDFYDSDVWRTMRCHL